MGRIPVRALIDNGDGTFSVPLSQGLFAIIDARDAGVVGQFNWSAVCATGTCYAQRMIPQERREEEGRNLVKMHRQIMGIDGPHVDHEDGNGLNNRRSNLRHASHAQNCMNRPAAKIKDGYKGVRRAYRGPYWQATIGIGKSYIHLGTFESDVIAAQAYDLAAIKMHGEFANLNFPRSNYPASVVGEPWRSMTRKAQSS